MHVLSLRMRRLGTAVIVAGGLVAGGLGAGYAAEGKGSPQPHSDSVGAAIDDTAITAQVRSKLNGTDRLKDSSIRIETTNGVVTLRGSVEDGQAKDQAKQIAQKVDGVKSVDNQLSVTGGRLANSEQAVSDSWITTKVKSRLVGNDPKQAFKVNVTTDNGVVTLKGTLGDESDVQRVTRIAREVEGVKSVNAEALTATSQ